MSETASPPAGPDFARGVAADQVTGRPLLGHVNGEAVLLTRVNGEFCAVGATCTHYGAPLHDGHAADGAVRCPWHHACFSLRTGRALRPPALFDLPRYRVERRGETLFVGGRLDAPAPRGTPAVRPRSVVIVGAGAAGNAAAETLRR